MNASQKTILLLNISHSDAEQFSAFISDSVRFLSVSDVASALNILKTHSVDLVITEPISKASLLQLTADDSVLSHIPVFSVARSFDDSHTELSATETALLKTTDELEKARYYEKFVYEAIPVAIVMYYIDWRPMPYINGNLFMLFGYSSEDVAEMHKNGLRGMVSTEDLAANNEIIMKAAREGTDRVTLEYTMFKKDGSTARVQEIASRFVDDDGSVGFISVFTDITDRYEMLEQLRRNESIMSTVGEHSERVIYYYDIAKNELRAINVEYAIRSGLADYCVDPVNTLFELSLIHDECVHQLNEFLDKVRNGEREGSFKLYMTCLDGVDRWFDVRFTSMVDGCGSVVGAVISMLDVTEQHDREISHERYKQTIDSALSNESVFFEFDITADLVEKQIGVIEPFTESYVDRSFTEAVEYLSRNINKKKQQRRVNAYLSKEMLLEAYSNDQRRISDDWPVLLEDGRKIWIHCSVQLVSDPYTQHIKLLMTLTDVTESKLKQLNILYQAENDGLTGLYNRTTIERKIEESLAADYRNSVFVLIDLDDLKYINDVLGHAQGDRAICAISDELIATFKGIGMEGRLGGDEFLVFIPNFPETENLDEMISGLLRRLTTITIGENNDNSLHCSMGVALADDSVHDFASLYKRADIALYHVKRNGKNNYSLFTDEMFDGDFRYKTYEFASFKNSALFDNLEFRRMMTSLANFYPQILLSNLTKNTICVLASSEGFSDALPPEGTIDNFTSVASEIIHPENSQEIISAISRETLLEEYEKGSTYLYFHCRLKDKDNQPRWIAFIIIFYKNADGDVCELALIRRANEKSVQRDVLRLQTALDISLELGVKLVCAVNPLNGAYEVVAGSYADIPSKGLFDRDIAPLCGSCVSDIETALRETPDRVYPFTKDAHAVFSCTEEKDGEIVMTVYKCGN